MVAEGKVSQQRVTDIKLNFGKLLRGRIDLYPQELRIGLTALRKEFDPATAATITHSQTPFLQNNSFVMFPRKMPDSARLQAQFNQKLQQAITSGRYQDYFDRLNGVNTEIGASPDLSAAAQRPSGLSSCSLTSSNQSLWCCLAQLSST